MMALRFTPHSSTGVSPHKVMTGRKMTLPHHLVFSYPEAAGGYDSQYTYVTELQENLKYTYVLVRDSLGQSARINKNFYDKKATRNEYEVGDKVYYFTFCKIRSKVNNSLHIGLDLIPLHTRCLQ